MTFITFHRRRRILLLSCGTQPCTVGVKRFLIVNAGEILCKISGSVNSTSVKLEDAESTFNKLNYWK